jgi:hypothetical protein
MHSGEVCPVCTVIAARVLAAVEDTPCPSCECRTLRVQIRDGSPYAKCMNCAWLARGRIVNDDE